MAKERLQRSSIGSLTGKKAQGSIDGFDKLHKNLLRLSDQVRVQVLLNAVQEGADETHAMMVDAAPINPGGATWKDVGHGADNILIAKPKRRAKKDRRVLDVGPGPKARHLLHQEFGTRFHQSQPFVRPTANAMRPKMIKIIERHMRIALRRGIR